MLQAFAFSLKLANYLLMYCIALGNKRLLFITRALDSNVTGALFSTTLSTSTIPEGLLCCCTISHSVVSLRLLLLDSWDEV